MQAEQELVLVVDDSKVNCQLLSAMLNKQGYRTITATNGFEAVEMFERNQPDAVLMDVNMPIMDGLAATRKIKELSGDRFVPVMFVTALDNENTLVDCVKAGGDDFVSKPFSPTILSSRLTSLLRTRRLYEQQYQQHQELRYYYDLIEQDQRVAEKIFSNIARSNDLDQSHIHYALTPMSKFNGDVLLAARSPDGREYILVGDFTGHGLSASVGSIPTSQVFRAMTTKGFPIFDIILEINQKIHEILPVGMFLAICGMEVTPKGEVTLWAGGLPDALALRTATGVIESYPPLNVPLGILPSSELNEHSTTLQLLPGDKLYLYSDGVTETQNDRGELFGAKRLQRTIFASATKSSGVPAILKSLDHFRGHGKPTDDLTLLEYRFDPKAFDHSRVAWRQFIQPRTEPAGGRWAANFTFSAETVRNFDPRPLVTELILSVQGLEKFRIQLYTILSELYSNALEHGLLGLDGSLKKTPEGLQTYYEHMAEAFPKLNKGWIRVELQHRPRANGGSLKFTVEDSGPGFDYRQWSANNVRLSGHQGHGFHILYELCQNIQFIHPGNQIIAHFDWLRTE